MTRRDRTLTLFKPLITSLAFALLMLAHLMHSQASSADTDGRIMHHPYSADRRFTSVAKGTDGTISHSDSGGSEARDSQGRTYSAGERHWTYKRDGKSVLGSEMLYRIHNPVADTDTRWDSTSKEVKVIHWPDSARDENLSPDCQVCAEAPTTNPRERIEKLGTRDFSGITAEGERTSYTVQADRNQGGTPIVVVHEAWYSPELQIVIFEINDDPRSGTTRNELLNIVRGEPDVSKYRPPADYAVHDLQVPVAQRH